MKTIRFVVVSLFFLTFWILPTAKSEIKSCKFILETSDNQRRMELNRWLRSLSHPELIGLLEFIDGGQSLEIQSPKIISQLKNLEEITQHVLENKSLRLRGNALASDLFYRLEELRFKVLEVLEHATGKNREAAVLSFRILSNLSKLGLRTPDQLSLVRYAKVLHGFFPFVRSRVADYMVILQDLGIQVSSNTQFELIKQMAKNWRTNGIQRNDVKTLMGIRDWGNPETSAEGQSVLLYMSNLFFQQKNWPDHKSNKTAGQFIKFLLLADPEFTYKLLSLKHFSRVVPELVVAEDGNGINCLQFVAAYFRTTMQKPVDWLEAFTKLKASESNAVITAQQMALQKVLSRDYPDIQMEYSVPSTTLVVDLFSESAKLVIEVDGGIHFALDSEGKKTLRLWDLRREAILKALGYRVIRFSNDEIERAILPVK